jgi:replicative DNA helicase
MDPSTALTVDTDSMQEVKRGAKEASRQQFLDRDPGSKMSTPTDWEEVSKLVKAKQTAVSTIMHPPKRKVKQTEKTGQKKGKTKVSLKKVASKQGVPKVTTTQEVRTLQDRTNTNSVNREPTIHLCGCRHGDLDALKRFNKNKAMYYIRPNRFLEGMGCRD